MYKTVVRLFTKCLNSMLFVDLYSIIIFNYFTVCIFCTCSSSSTTKTGWKSISGIQCGFMSKRCTTGMFFSVLQLQEKCNEQNLPLYIAFIDLTKAFDLESREELFAILFKIGCPPNLFNTVKSFHTNTRATIQWDGSISDSF